MSILKPKDVSRILNVSQKTLQRWDKDGTLIAYRNPKNRRYYTQEQIDSFLGKKTDKQRKHIAYSRVSNESQKNNLINQNSFIQNYVNAKGIILDDFISDIGSGLNYKRENWNKLLDMVINNEVDTIYITYKDRFVRFGFDWFKDFCNKFNTKIVVLNNKNFSPKEELIEDLNFIIDISSHRVYNLEKYKNKIKDDLDVDKI